MKEVAAMAAADKHKKCSSLRLQSSEANCKALPQTRTTLKTLKTLIPHNTERVAQQHTECI